MASKTGTHKKSKWSMDFASSKAVSKGNEYASPPGYNPAAGQNHSEVAKETDQSHLIIKKSWELALGPIKQVPMNLLVMYMSGNSISIFPIMMVGMMVIRLIKALFSTGSTFKAIEGHQLIGQKAAFFMGNLVNMGLALYKCHSMGLLPTHSSDWLAFIQAQERLEYSGGGISLL